MPSVIYSSTVDAIAKGTTIAFATDTFRVILVDDTYVPNKAVHSRRSDVGGEVTGSGYSQGGELVTVNITTDTLLSCTDIALGGAEWPASTIMAAGAVYFDSRGAPEDDELICYIGFGSNVSSLAGSFRLEPSTLRIQN
jgi:hypothetical protein